VSLVQSYHWLFLAAACFLSAFACLLSMPLPWGDTSNPGAGWVDSGGGGGQQELGPSLEGPRSPSGNWTRPQQPRAQGHQGLSACRSARACGDGPVFRWSGIRCWRKVARWGLRYLRVRGTARADSRRRSGVGLAPRPQALPMPAAALVLYTVIFDCKFPLLVHARAGGGLPKQQPKTKPMGVLCICCTR
jgi:hypothetical protein